MRGGIDLNAGSDKHIVPASIEPPMTVASVEQRPYRRLQYSPQGRLEQEFIPLEIVQRTVTEFTESPGHNL